MVFISRGILLASWPREAKPCDCWEWTGWLRLRDNMQQDTMFYFPSKSGVCLFHSIPCHVSPIIKLQVFKIIKCHPQKPCFSRTLLEGETHRTIIQPLVTFIRRDIWFQIDDFEPWWMSKINKKTRPSPKKNIVFFTNQLGIIEKAGWVWSQRTHGNW